MCLVWFVVHLLVFRFTISGEKDVKVSWTIKVLRNDPACQEDLRRRPVEQLKSELSPDQVSRENVEINTIAISESKDLIDHRRIVNHETHERHEKDGDG